jgi:hypothetical protein
VSRRTDSAHPRSAAADATVSVRTVRVVVDFLWALVIAAVTMAAQQVIKDLKK